LKSWRTNALNVRFLADHVRFTPNGRHWRRVIGTSAADPLQTFAKFGRLHFQSLSNSGIVRRKSKKHITMSIEKILASGLLSAVVAFGATWLTLLVQSE
jgi:hypothetical protein